MYRSKPLTVSVLAMVCAWPAVARAQSEAAPAADTQIAAGIGQGLKVERSDGMFSLMVRARAQLRFELQSNSTEGDEGHAAFQARRVRLALRGHLLSKDLEYYIQLGFANRDTEPDLRLPLRDAAMTWKRLRDLNIRFGQMKVPYGRQRVTSSSALALPDRSIVTNELNLDRDTGVQLLSEDLFGQGGRFGYSLYVMGGDGRNRAGTDFGLLYGARVKVNPFGKFEDSDEADLEREDRMRLSLAASAAMNRNSVRHRSTFDATYTLGDFDFVHLGADLVLKYRGLFVLGEFFYRDVTGDRQLVDAMTGLTETSRTGYGYLTQAGFMLTEHAEVEVRQGELHPKKNVATDLPRGGELGGGLNWYFHEHELKLQADYFWLYEGPLADGVGRHEVRLQAQFYL